MNYKKLIQHWTDQGIGHGPGASRSDIAAFEQQHGVHLSMDLHNYFREVNGFSKLSAKELDEKGFQFYPLTDVISVTTALRDLSGSYPPLVDSDHFFVFADFLHWSWGFAIELLPDSQAQTRIIPIGKMSYPILATSFAQFVELYLMDDKRIYAG